MTAASEAKTKSGEPIVNRRAMRVTAVATSRPAMGARTGAPWNRVWVKALPAKNQTMTKMIADAAMSKPVGVRFRLSSVSTPASPSHSAMSATTRTITHAMGETP